METFQLVISTDGEVSFAAFIYNDSASITDKIIGSAFSERRLVSIGFDSGNGLAALKFGEIFLNESKTLAANNLFRIDGTH